LLEELAMLHGTVVPAMSALALLLAGSGAASAQVAAGGLGTRVNGTALGRCSAGVCSVQGGSAAGPNLFHRFSQFDTRAGIQRVDLDSRGRSNVVVGVSHPAGSFFGAPLRLSGAANLFWLSPGGIWLGNGARFPGATSLLLSTAPTLRLGGGTFNALGGMADRLGAWADTPSLDLEALAQGGLEGGALGRGDGPILLAGGRLTVDRHLLLDSGAGPIRSLTGQGSQLQAGRSVQLSGGELQLRGLDVMAGTNALDDLVRLRSGPLAGGGTGRLELAQSSLRGARVLVEGAGGLELRQVEARASGASGSSLVQLSAGAAGLAAAARLDGVTLTGGDVLVHASGPLAASNLQARAGVDGGGGRLELGAGPAAAGEPSLRLERSQLEGRNLAIGANGPGTLQQVRLAADSVQVRADGDLTLRELAAEGGAIRLWAGGRLTLDASQLRASGEAGQIQLDALAAGDPKRGRMELQASRLEAPLILGRADETLSLRDVTASAGEPGRRGLIQLETAPTPDPADAGASGEANLAGVRLEGQRLLVRSGTIQVSGSRLEAPKGMIHLEAKAGDLEVAASSLDVGVRHEADLATPVNRRSVVAGVIFNESLPPPSVGLFAAADLRLLDGSRILASQDIDALRQANPALRRDAIRLTDSSGIVVADAGQALTVRDSLVAADATDNLAGNVLLRAQATGGPGGLTLRNATLSASGGAGSGDIRLSSANGMFLEGSRLLAQSTNTPADLRDPARANWRTPFSGGEITLTNSSPQRGINVVDSQLRAEQSSSGRLLSPAVLDGRDEGLPFRRQFLDAYDAGDFGLASIGGIVNLISAGGLSLVGDSLVSVDSRPAEAGPLESLGGTLRIINFAAEPVEIRDGTRLSYATGPQPSPATPARDGELIQLDPAPVPLPDDLDWGAGRDANFYLLQPGAESLDQVFTGGDAYDTPGGLPGEIRARLQPPPTDLLFLPGEPPQDLRQLLGSGPAGAEGIAGGAGFPTPEAAPADPNGWLPIPSLTSARLTPAATLAFSSPPAGAGSALTVESSQAMPEAAAARSFQAAEQESARAVSTALGLQPPPARPLEIAELQRQLRAAQPAVPAILQISRSVVPGTALVQINQILIPANGEIRGWQTRIAAAPLQRAIEVFQRQLRTQAPLDGPDAEAGEQLGAALLAPSLPELRRLGITTLLLALDRGLQGIPFAALPVEGGSLVERMAITVTPALSLTDLTPPSGHLPPRRTLLAGASHFRNGLAPLPMAAEELQQLAALHPQALVLLDDNFNTRAVLEQTQARSVEILHLATHAEFTRQSANSARVYTSDGELSLAELGRVLRRQRRSPLALFVLNACRTAMGDEQNELGIAGLALQAGATSALGNLWYVDDVVSAAFSVQFHRALQQGLPSDEALQRTQRLFRQGAIQVRGDRIVSSDGAILLSGLSRADQARLAGPLTHPYFWAGAILSGKPW
jgi:CHAT domain-containing protein